VQLTLRTRSPPIVIGAAVAALAAFPALAEPTQTSPGNSASTPGASKDSPGHQMLDKGVEAWLPRRLSLRSRAEQVG
jgi:hypothetical protein